MVTDKKKH